MSEALDKTLASTQEVTAFLREFLERLPDEDLKQGDDLRNHVKRLGLTVPRELEGLEITWSGRDPHTHCEAGDAGSLVVVGPGHPDAVGLVIKCIRVGKWHACLECGWFWCRIVLTRRF